jgi:hypothetical protein
VQGPFLSQTAYAYLTVAQAGVVWRRVVTSRLLRCAAAALRAGSGGGTTFTVSSRKVVPLQGLARTPAGVTVARYRIGGSASAAGQTLPVYLDELVVSRGPLITAIDVTSFSDPPADKLERRILRRAVSRLLA